MRDKIVKKLIEEEARRQRETLDLIPSENFVSRDVLEALGAPLTNKYSEGYPGRRYYAGNKIIDEIESLARDRARKAFRLGRNWHVNVQPYSGSPANMAVYYALLEPARLLKSGERSGGDKIMGMSLPFGGHLTHGWRVNFSGRLYESAQYTVGRDGLLDYKEIEKMARREKPKILVAGATAYPRKFDFEKFGKIAHGVGAYFLADISHIAGLVIAGAHPSPFPRADVVMTTTHKTLRGPRGAILFANRNSQIARKNKIDIASAIDRAVFPGLQGGPHDNQTAAIAVALKEAASPSFRRYGRQIARNAKILSHELSRLGFDLVTGGTDNHLMLLDLTGIGISGREAQDTLEGSGIIVNRNTIPYDARSPFDPSGIRLGTPALTTRGMKEREMKKIAELIYEILVLRKKRLAEVKKLCGKFPVPR